MVLGLLLKKFLMSDHETWFTGILRVLPDVCEKWALCANFRTLFWPQIVPKLGRKPVFHLFCKRLPLDSHETCLLSSMELLLKVCRILALDSHGSCLLSSLELLFGGLRIWAPWGLWGLFAASVRFLYSHSLYYFWVVMDRFSTLISWII